MPLESLIAWKGPRSLLDESGVLLRLPCTVAVEISLKILASLVVMITLPVGR